MEVGPEDGLRHQSSIHCDQFVSFPKSVLTDYVSSLALDPSASADPSPPRGTRARILSQAGDIPCPLSVLLPDRPEKRLAPSIR